jgi:hypothetical protein
MSQTHITIVGGIASDANIFWAETGTWQGKVDGILINAFLRVNLKGDHDKSSVMPMFLLES